MNESDGICEFRAMFKDTIVTYLKGVYPSRKTSTEISNVIGIKAEEVRKILRQHRGKLFLSFGRCGWVHKKGDGDSLDAKQFLGKVKGGSYRPGGYDRDITEGIRDEMLKGCIEKADRDEISARRRKQKVLTEMSEEQIRHKESMERAFHDAFVKKDREEQTEELYELMKEKGYNPRKLKKPLEAFLPIQLISFYDHLKSFEDIGVSE